MFLFFYNFCFIANPAWNNFLFLGLNFTNFGYGMLAFAGALLSVAGLSDAGRHLSAARLGGRDEGAVR